MPTAARTHPNVARAVEYAYGVAEGKIPACRFTRLACERHIRDLDLVKKQKDSPFFYDPEAAERVCTIVQHFPHIRGIWATHQKRIELEGWQCFILCSVFGWISVVTNGRRFRVVYIEVPRKNAKSTLTSAVGNYMLACDGEAGAQIVSAANTMQQAKIVFADAQHMARKEKGFLRKFGVEVLAHTIVQTSSASKFEALAAEYSNLDGLNLHAALIDELHAHPTRGLWDVLTTAIGSRLQPLIWAITTAGVNRASVCYDQRSYVIDLLEQRRQDDSYFGIIYTADDGDDPWAEETWIKTNPNYGVSVNPEGVRVDAKRAMQMPSEQANFFMRRLDIWVNADLAWLPAGSWDKCGDAALDIEDFVGDPCYIGIDLAYRNDIAAVVAAFPPQGARQWWAVFGTYYLPEETINRSENSHFQAWEAAGRMVATPGAVTDFDYILSNLIDLCARHNVREIVHDPFHSGPLVNDMEKQGLPRPVEVRQNATNMHPPLIELEGLVLSQKIRHDADPVLAWMVSNVKVRRVGDLMKPVKDAEDKKIDGVICMLMCINRGIRQAAPAPKPGIHILSLGDDL